MELKSFREILLKKADGNPYLETLIKYAKDELIAEEVIESLLKMAEPSAAMGRGANHGVTSFAANLTPTHIEQMRDALGHHISHYRGALKSMHAATDPKEKARLRGVADQHLNKIIPIMHIAGRAGKHSGGQMTLDYPSTTPWESNYTTIERRPDNGKLKEGTKDLGRRPSPNANREKNKKAVPDYRYLEMAPHGGHASSGKMPHKGGYPFEEIQLGSPAKRDTGQAYLPLEDVGEVNNFVPHPFDQHPIHQIADDPEHHLTQEQKDKFNADLAGWESTEHHKKWLADQKAKYQKDPEAYKARGTSKPSHHYEGIPLLDQPEEAKAHMPLSTNEVNQSAVPSETQSVEAPSLPISQPAQSEAVSTPAASMQEDEDPELHQPPAFISKDIAKLWNQFPPAAKRAMIEHGRGKK